MTDPVIMTRGVDFALTWILKSDPDTFVDLTNFNILVQIRPTKRSSHIIGSYDRTSPYLTVTDNEGMVDLVLPPSVTSVFGYDKAVIDCWFYDDIDVEGERSATLDIIYDAGVSHLG